MKKYDVVGKCGEYEQNGEKKARWVTCGIAIENDKGIRIKLNSIPVGKEWDGWFSLKDADRNTPIDKEIDKENLNTKTSTQTSKSSTQINQATEASAKENSEENNANDIEEEIPF